MFCNLLLRIMIKTTTFWIIQIGTLTLRFIDEPFFKLVKCYGIDHLGVSFYNGRTIWFYGDMVGSSEGFWVIVVYVIVVKSQINGFYSVSWQNQEPGHII
jgi:hypothetical protein